MRARINPSDLCTSIAVYPKPGVDPERLAKTVERKVSGIKAAGPSAFKEQVGNQMKMFNGIIFSVALISLVVGGMSVVNTMTMTVSERTREIGIRKAIGAGTGAVMRQFIAESGLIGLLGGLTRPCDRRLRSPQLLNLAAQASGTMLFLVTARLAARVARLRGRPRRRSPGSTPRCTRRASIPSRPCATSSAAPTEPTRLL